MQGIKGANEILGGLVMSLASNTVSGRGGIAFSSCPHCCKDDIPLTSAHNNVATSA